MKKYKFLIISVLSILSSCGSTILTNNSFNTTSNNQMTTDVSNAVDVVLLGGQSNMEGHTSWGKMSDEDYSKYERGFKTQITYDKSAIVFKDCSIGQGRSYSHFGPELGMAERIDEANLTKPIYFIKYAQGSTDLENDWKSTSRGTPGVLYEGFVEYAHNALNKIESMGLIPRVKAFCWMQGEDDASNYAMTLNYEANLEYLINDIRSEFSSYAVGCGVKFIDAAISNCVNVNDVTVWKYHEEVNLAKKTIAIKDTINRFYIDTNEEGLVNDPEKINGGDTWHYDIASMIKLGHLFADILINNSIIG